MLLIYFLEKKIKYARIDMMLKTGKNIIWIKKSGWYIF